MENKLIDKIESLLLNGSKEVYICQFCGDIGDVKCLLFPDKISRCCPICKKQLFRIVDYIDILTKYNEIKNVINRIYTFSNLRKFLLGRRSEIRLILNKTILEKIKKGDAMTQITTCPRCNGSGNNCSECNNIGIIKIDKNNYRNYSHLVTLNDRNL